MAKKRWGVGLLLTLVIIVAIPGYAAAGDNSGAVALSYMPEPELSADGLRLSNAQNIGIVVIDTNPYQEAIHIPATEELRDIANLSSTFEFTYQEAGQTDPWNAPCNAVTDDIKQAFNQAGIIWGNLLKSAAPIKIQVCWAELSDTNVLGYSGGAEYYRDFTNAPRSGTWYASSLANSLAGKDLGSGKNDIYITFNRKISWYTETDANPPSTQFDLVTIALHEICHGLNFSGMMSYISGFAQWGSSGYPNIYDTFMRDESGVSIIDTSIYPNNSMALGEVVTSGKLWFHGPLAMSQNSCSRVKMYAPTTWQSGSSYSHLDYDSFASGNNKLMRYAIPPGTAIHYPGPVTMSLLQDLGWKTGAVITGNLSVSPTGRYVSKDSGTATFSVTNTGTGTMPWTAVVSSASSWIRITEGSCSSDKGTITCLYDANTATTPRTGTIKVTASSASGTPIYLTITQAGTVYESLSPVPDTGQTTCYGSDCKSSTCSNPGESLYGQDANYSINPISYTKLDDSGNPLPNSATSWAMVRDNITNLIWEIKNDWDGVKNYKNPHDADNAYSWYDGSSGTPGDGSDTSDFIKALNDAHYGGYSDWRLPTIKELHHLVFIKSGKSIDTGYFPNIQGSEYWSSTPYNFGVTSAWCLNFNGGGIITREKYKGKYACAVRGEKVDSLHDSDRMKILQDGGTVDGRYVDNRDGTVSDTITGLMWQQTTPDNGMTWENALEYCESSNLANFSDWRLPTIKELVSLVDYDRYDPAIIIGCFPDTVTDDYWTSTTEEGASCYALMVNFYQGDDGAQPKNWGAYVRPVRGGQANASGYLVVSPLNHTVTKEAGSTVFTVSNGGMGTLPWSASIIAGSDWLKITNGSSGTNSGAITCSFSANTGSTVRTGTLRVTAAGISGETKDVTVTQEASSAKLIISGNIKTGLGAVMPGVVITLNNNGGTATTDSSGNYSLSVPNNYSGTATPLKTGYSFSPASRTYSSITFDQSGQNYTGNLPLGSSSQFLGVWPDGVWMWDKAASKWTMMASTANASMIAAGKIDMDQVDDLIGVWPSGLYLRQSSNGQWIKLSGDLPIWIAVGDLNNDGREDVIASWTNDGTCYRDSAAGNWIELAESAKQLASGNIGGTQDDLASVFNDGLWVRYSATASWKKIDVAIPIWMTVGDMNGDKQADIIGSYSSGTWYRNSATAGWTLLTTPATQLAVGDIDGDGRDDLVGIWSNKVYVLYGATSQWQMISASKPNWITTGRMAAAVQTAGTLDDPNGRTDVVDLSSEGPGGETFEMMTDRMDFPVTVK